MSFRVFTQALFGVSLLGLVGCTDDLESITEITKNRVLAARFVPQDSTARAWPRLGEEATVRWTVVDEAEPRPLTYALAVCPKLPFGTNPVCGGPPFTVLTRSEPSTEDPEITFTVPEGLGESREVLVAGLICAEGTAIVDPNNLEADCIPLSGSDAESRGTPVVFALPVELGSSNQHPVFADDFITLGIGEVKATWLATGANRTPGAPCADVPTSESLPHVSQATEDKITVEFLSPAANFERYQEDGTDLQENVTVSGFSTAGKFDRSLSSLTETEPRSDVVWAPPEPEDVDDNIDVGEDGAIALFYFVSRDGRAGTHVTTRQMCILP